MNVDHDEWLALTLEEPIDPALPICDPHHHLFDLPERAWALQPPGVPARYLLDELARDIGQGHNVISTVTVESWKVMSQADGFQRADPADETAFADAVGRQADRRWAGTLRVAAGIVGFADLGMGAAVASVLEAHQAASTRLRGIRRVTAWDASPGIRSDGSAGLLLDPLFREGFACLQRYGLSFDALVYHTQLMELFDLATSFPGIPIVLEHAGIPLGIGAYATKRATVREIWKDGISALASCPNVVVKLGGMAMPACGFGWSERSVPPGSEEVAEALAPYYLWCIEQFGPRRCMFESNFPIERQSCSYTILWNAYKRIAQDLPPAAVSSLFHDTAVSTYGL